MEKSAEKERVLPPLTAMANELTEQVVVTAMRVGQLTKLVTILTGEQPTIEDLETKDPKNVLSLIDKNVIGLMNLNTRLGDLITTLTEKLVG